ncbi:HAD family phosphatase [Candidatus Saccharibacteria bacterium]|nr:HAD family phosphatase [Candidatus Saccharibacteria bacterium]
MHTIESYKQFRGFVFDLDDTLLDNSGGPNGTPLHAVSKFAAFRSAALLFGIEALEYVTVEQERAAFRRASEHNLRGGLRSLFEEICPNITESEFDELYEYIKAQKKELHLGVMEEYVKPIKGAREIIRLLASRGYADRQAIASGAHRDEILLFLTLSKLDRYFTDKRIIGQEDVSLGKPSPEGMLMAAESMRRVPGDERPVLVFEDDPKGFEAARNADMWVVGLTTRYSEEEILKCATVPDLIVPDLATAIGVLGIRAGL